MTRCQRKSNATRYPEIPKSILDRCHKQHADGLSWLDVANANRLGYTAMMNQLRNAGYDMSLKHPHIRGRSRALQEREPSGLNSTAIKLLTAPLLGN